MLKKIKRYFGKPILATDPNFSISSGFLAEIFAAGMHQQKNASGIPSYYILHSHHNLYTRWNGSVGSPLWSEHQTRGGMAQSVEHIVHIDGVVGSSPTVTTTNPVGVQVQRLPDFFAYPSRVRTFRSQEYALFCQRGTQKGYADHLKTAYPCRRLVHINQ